MCPLVSVLPCCICLAQTWVLAIVVTEAVFPFFQTVKGMLDNPNEPVSDLSYFDCIEGVMENSKVIL